MNDYHAENGAGSTESDAAPFSKRRVWKKTARGVACVLSIALAFGAAGCAAQSLASTESEAGAAGGSVAASAASLTVNDDLSAYDLEYSKRDLDPSYSAEQAMYITLADNSSSASTYTGAVADGVSIDGQEVTITQAGTYVLSGALSDGCVYVNISKEEKCQLVLDGVSITNEDGPCIYIMAADKTFITLADGSENTLVDGANYVLNEDDEPTATIFSKDDLTLNGAGALNITGNYRHAVRSKDDLVITGGTYVVNAVEDALNGKDCLKICDGTFDITCGEDALKSSNDSEEGRGFVTIDGGEFSVSAGDDAVHAETLMRITDGTVNIATCYEGYEGALVRIDGGTTSINASDDGINAASGSTGGGEPGAGGFSAGGAGGRGFGGSVAGEPGSGGTAAGKLGADTDAGDSGASSSFATASCKIVVTGGTTYVSAGGDGIDSNGDVEITGGVLIVEGPTSNSDSFLDYDGTATIDGGTVLMVGQTGMAQDFSGGSQAFALVQVSGSAGQSVVLQDSQGNEVTSFTATKNFQMALVSAPGTEEGDTLMVEIGGISTNLTASTSSTASSMGGPGGVGGMRDAGSGPGGMGGVAGADGSGDMRDASRR